MHWMPIETAPKGSGIDGPDRTSDANYIHPPRLILWTPDGLNVGHYDWYYHEGYGYGASSRDSAWCDMEGNEIFPTHWLDDIPEVPSRVR